MPQLSQASAAAELGAAAALQIHAERLWQQPSELMVPPPEVSFCGISPAADPTLPLPPLLLSESSANLRSRRRLCSSVATLQTADP